MDQRLLETIVQAERWFPQTFAEVEEREWGVFFTTPTIPDSYDGNHACLLDPGDHPARVLDEIIEFYEERGLDPRVYFISAKPDHPALREALRATGFTIAANGSDRIFLHQNPSRISPNPAVLVKRLDQVDAPMLDALIRLGNPRAAKVLQRRTAQPEAWLFVGYLDDKAASVALLERQDSIARIDEVATAEHHRCKGCARAVIHTLIDYYQTHLTVPLFLWTDNPIAERIYLEAGFTKQNQTITNWSAWRPRASSRA